MAGLIQNIVTDEQENKVAESMQGSAVVVVVLKLVKYFHVNTSKLTKLTTYYQQAS